MKKVTKVANCKKIGIETPCPLHWKQLEVTKEKNVKYCNVCEDKVYFCENDEELIKNATKGNCIAFAQVDRSLKDAKYSDRNCDKCGFPIASFRKECWVCKE